MRHTTLNEQISRMKELFTDERLYGNLVEVNEKKNKPLLLEQGPSKLIGDFLTYLWDGMVKKGVSKKISKVDPNTVYKVGGDANNLRIFRNGVEIDPSDLSQIISDRTSSAIKSQIRGMNTTTKVKQYLSGNPNGPTIQKHFELLVDDLVKQGLLKTQGANKLLDDVTNSGIFNSLSDIFRRDTDAQQFIKTINSDIEFRKNYPEIYELFTHIPDFKKNFDEIYGTTTKVTDNAFILYDTLNVIKKWNDPLEKKIGIVDIKTNGNKLLIKVDDLTSSMKREGVNTTLKKEIKQNFDDIVRLNPELDGKIKFKKDGSIEIDISKLNDAERDMVDKLVKNRKGLSKVDDVMNDVNKTIDNTEKVKVAPIRTLDITDTDVMDQVVDDALKKKWYQIDAYSVYLDDFLTKNIKKMKITADRFFGTPAGKVFADVLSSKVAKGVDASWLRRNGYIRGISGSGKGISEEQAKLLNKLYELDDVATSTTKKETSIFVENAEEQVKYGLPKGSIKPNVKEVDNFKEVLREEIRVGIKKYNFASIPLKSEIGYAKTVRSLIMKSGGILTIAGLVELGIYIGLQVKRYFYTAAIEAGKKFIIDFLLDQNVDGNLFATTFHLKWSNKCLDVLKSSLRNAYSKMKIGSLADGQINSLFGSSKEGVVKGDPILGGTKLTARTFPVLKKDKTKEGYAAWDGAIYNIQDKAVRDTINLPEASIVGNMEITKNLNGEWVINVYKNAEEIGEPNAQYAQVPVSCTYGNPDGEFKNQLKIAWDLMKEQTKDEASINDVIDKMKENVIKSASEEQLNPKDIINDMLNDDFLGETVESIEYGIDHAKEKSSEIGDKIENATDNLHNNGTNSNTGTNKNGGFVRN